MTYRSVWFQMARGRAIARTNAMKAARRAQRTRANVLSGRTTAYDAATYGLHTPLSVELKTMLAPEKLREFVVEMLDRDIAHDVQRARQAHRQWREYRKRVEADRAWARENQG